ncbi:MAG: hypothetical protein M5U34_24525 [Chloroflexi bacterium]|nr:hypothetical protein [Chloroflexota bacterium]
MSQPLSCPPPSARPLRHSPAHLPPDDIDQRPVAPRAAADLELLLNTDYPAHDYF